MASVFHPGVLHSSLAQRMQASASVAVQEMAKSARLQCASALVRAARRMGMVSTDTMAANVHADPTVCRAGNAY